METKDLDRVLRATLWPALFAHGFRHRTQRVAWRYAGDDVDVIELQTVGRYAEETGCPSLSISVFVAASPRFVPIEDRNIPVHDGRSRPHYWHCDPFRRSMPKTIPQPWFRPFSQPPNERLPRSFRLHRDALRRLVDRHVQDVPDIWYMREDGSNLEQNLHDLTSVVLTSGLALIDRFNDPRQALELIDSGWLMVPTSPHANELRAAIEGYLAAGQEGRLPRQ
jgi:hypothetical protein